MKAFLYVSLPHGDGNSLWEDPWQGYKFYFITKEEIWQINLQKDVEQQRRQRRHNRQEHRRQAQDRLG